MIKRSVLLRADGNNSIGLGHVARCCALAEILKDEFDCYFYIRKTSQVIIEDIKKYCVAVVELDDGVSYEEEAHVWSNELNKEPIVVLDGYNFNTGYQSQIKSKGCKLVCVDDIHAYYFYADVVINHAPGIPESAYFCAPHTKLCLGTKYAILKKHFLTKASDAEKKFEFTESPILICLGGADPHNQTLKTVQKVQKLLPDRKIIIVVGAAFSNKDFLENYCAANPNLSLFVNIAAGELICLMEKAHIAVMSASTIALEYICIKGNLFLVQTANNQGDLYKSLLEKKCAYPFEVLRNKYDSNALILNQYALIDGQSNKRIREIFCAL